MAPTARQRRMPARSSFVIIGALLLGAAACSNRQSPGATSPAPSTTAGSVPVAVDDSLAGTNWTAESFITVAGLQPIGLERPPTLVFDNQGRVNIFYGCNSGSADVAFGVDHELTITNALRTLMACQQPNADVETQVSALLAMPLSWDVSGNTLKLLPTKATDLGMILHAAG